MLFSFLFFIIFLVFGASVFAIASSSSTSTLSLFRFGCIYMPTRKLNTIKPCETMACPGKQSDSENISKYINNKWAPHIELGQVMFCRTPSEMIWHFVCKLKRLNLCLNLRLRRRRRSRRVAAGVRIHHHHQHHHRYQHWIATKLLQLFLSSSDSAIRVFISPFRSQQQIFSILIAFHFSF